MDVVRSPDGVSCTVARADGRRLPFADGAFDRIIASEVLEHVPDDLAVLAELHRVLRPGGVLVTSFAPIWSCAVGHHLWGRLADGARVADDGAVEVERRGALEVGRLGFFKIGGEIRGKPGVVGGGQTLGGNRGDIGNQRVQFNLAGQGHVLGSFQC